MSHLHAHSSMAMSDSSSSSSSSMAMTFSKFSDYEVSILFEAWTTTTPAEFTMAWILVVLATIAYHALRYGILIVEEKIGETNIMIKSATANASETEPLNSSSRRSSPEVSLFGEKHGLTLAKREKFKWRIMHALLTACSYGMALLLMLIAMTYNTMLFFALVIGYGIGSFIFSPVDKHFSDRTSEDLCH